MYQEKTPAFLVQQQLLNYVVRAMVTLLGRHCSWECENTGVIHCGNIFAISIDGTVKNMFWPSWLQVHTTMATA